MQDLKDIHTTHISFDSITELDAPPDPSEINKPFLL